MGSAERSRSDETGVAPHSNYSSEAGTPKRYGDDEEVAMASAPDRPVTIDQPVVNKFTVLGLASVAAFIAAVFASNVDATLFQLALVAFAVACGFYAYRAIQVSAVADRQGITVTNLRRQTHHPWSSVDVLSVGPVPRGPGTGIAVDLADGTSVPVEASWGAWYEGKQAAGNTARCEAFVTAIAAMRVAPTSDGSEPEEPMVDRIVVRPMEPDDAPTAAAFLRSAWRRTYGELLTNSAMYDRDVDEDTRMLTELLSDDIPRSGGLVALRNDEIVGVSVFGPPARQPLELEDCVEIYLLYADDEHPEDRVGARLTIRTLYAIRATGARGVVGHVHAGYRDLRRTIETRGMEPAGDVTEQNWYGLPVNVVRYQRAFGPTLASNPPIRR